MELLQTLRNTRSSGFHVWISRCSSIFEGNNFNSDDQLWMPFLIVQKVIPIKSKEAKSFWKYNTYVTNARWSPSCMIFQEKIIMTSSHDDEWPCGVSKSATMDYLAGLLWGKSYHKRNKSGNNTVILKETLPKWKFEGQNFARATRYFLIRLFSAGVIMMI